MRASGGAAERLTSRPGTYAATPSPDGRALAVLVSDDVTPAELALMDAAPGATPRVVTHSPGREFATQPWVRPRYVDLPHVRDPYTVRARVFLPPGLDTTRAHPVLFGPVYSNTVRNAWSPRWSPLMQYLAIEKGYIVVQVDVRGSTGYGRAYREAFLGEWGRSDLGDLESVVGWLKTQRWADTQRMGIWGSSYGGLLSVYALLGRPGLFRAGVAGAPAVDPRWFGSDDAAIARTPGEAPATFERRASRDVARLQDHLLIIHGMQDDVVPFHTTVQLLDAFIGAGKDVEVAFAPAATHGWAARPAVGRYLFTRLVDFFDRWVAR
jgi:dipeptidyl-peptidase-4